MTAPSEIRAATDDDGDDGPVAGAAARAARDADDDPRPVTPAAPSGDDPTTRRLGEALLALGTTALVSAAFVARGSGGGVAAAALFTVIIGVAVRYPTLLQDGSTSPSGAPNVSSMRVAVLIIVSVFGVLTLKAGWSATSIEALKINDTWVYLLGVALGAKALQSIAEGVGPGPKNK
jgi:hypothetical protein